LENAFPRLSGWRALPLPSNIRTIQKTNSNFPKITTDDEWIAKVAREGWVIFSHDRKFHVRMPEIAAIKQYKAGCFYLPGANWPTWDKARHFMRFCDGLTERIEVTIKPFIYSVAATGKFTQISIP
jgi:hypothetical protein